VIVKEDLRPFNKNQDICLPVAEAKETTHTTDDHHHYNKEDHHNTTVATNHKSIIATPSEQAFDLHQNNIHFNGIFFKCNQA
jgi:hypothetical protein